MLNALFKVNMFDTLLKFGLSISIFYHQLDDMTMMNKFDEQVVDCLFIPLSL